MKAPHAHHFVHSLPLEEPQASPAVARQET